MEDSALTSAQSHARRAAEETARVRLTVAGTEHDLAAEQYLRAADDTSDTEALRILKLLEDHHHKLAQIVKAKDEYSKRIAPARDDTADNQASKEVISTTQQAPASSVQAHNAPGKSTPTFLKTRDTPSSLAKDIASRRGIPQSQQRRSVPPAANVSPVQAAGRITTPSRHGGVERLSEDAPPFDKGSASLNAPARPTPTDSPVGDDGFARFYSNLTAGPFSRLSSMLAFAGLPLHEVSPEDSPTASKVEKTSARVFTGPDVDQLFSKAAIRALEEQQRHPGNAFGPGESFYVIPTSGGTASYANILSRQQPMPGGGSRDRRGSRGDETDEFVDAREVLSDSDQRAKHGQTQSHIATETSLREEELQIENAALKQILDKLSHRLQAFESHAQDASMQALAQSMASTRTTTTVPLHELEERMRAMESQLEREMKEREKLGLENQKNKQIIAKYRSHWEQLKDSARAKEKAKREKEKELAAR
ncbi:hypothetical protein K461DRAFT_245725 [Myriangium duriaei CBS 260.36]|uniref:MIT domain-containing protein n=1 Tax=Myriangium duriaei CBS 260.36 TaxID=1168546 RepID=A0A9P4IWR4_9PEZI|nr:hypothetical protein K461DRAFT_245725 [Myriangium duriaei CBS 260.36]